MVSIERSMTTETRADKLELIGGRLCLDFTNTTSGRKRETPNDRLTSYLELATWGRYVGILTEEQAGRLLVGAEQRPEDADGVLRRAISLREALYQIFSSGTAGVSPSETDLATL